MRIGKKAGSTHRPVEYALLIILIVLIITAFWIQMVIRREDQAGINESPASDQQLQGTTQEIDQFTQDELTEEALTDSSYDQREQSIGQVDAAADDIGGAYDETVY